MAQGQVRTPTDDDPLRIVDLGCGNAYLTFAAHRFLRVNFFVATDFPDPAFRLDAVVAQLRERRPVYVIFERLNSRSEMGRAVDAIQEEPLVADLLRGYRREADIEDFTVYRRAD